MIGPIDTGQALQQAMVADNTPQIKFFQTRCIKAGQQHIIDHEDIHLAPLEGIPLFFQFVLCFANGGKHQCGTECAACAKFLMDCLCLLAGIGHHHGPDGIIP